MLKNYKNYIPLAVIIILMIVALCCNWHKYLTFSHLKEHRLTIEVLIAQYPNIAIIAFCLIYIITIILSMPGAAVLTVIGGYVFDYLYGTIYVVISATLGASVVFLSTRMASEQTMVNQSKPWLQKMQNGFLKNTWPYLITLRLIPIFPFFAVNIAAAIFKVPFHSFFWCTLIGIIPSSFIYIAIGVAMRNFIEQPDISPTDFMTFDIIMIITGMAALIVFPIIYQSKKINESKQKSSYY